MSIAWHGVLDDVQVLVDDLAEVLGRSVVVNDPLVRLMYASRHFHDEDPVRVRAVLQRDAGAEVVSFVLARGVTTWRRPGMLPANPAIELLARFCVPLRGPRELLGLLMVIDADHTLTAAERARIEEVAGSVTALLTARAAVGDAARSAREAAVDGLLSAEPADREAACGRLLADGANGATGVGDRPCSVVTTVEVTADERTAAQIELALRSALAPHEAPVRGSALTSVDGGRARLVQLARRPPDTEDLATHGRALAHAVTRALGARATAVVGVGEVVGEVGGGLADAWRSARGADLALRAARLLPHLDGVALWSRLGDYALLLRLPPDALTAEVVPPALRALLAHQAGPRLHRTLAVYLDEAGSVPRTSERLHLHRTSLYYRLRQIADITGLDLDDGAHRLVLHEGLRAVELLGGAV